MSRREVAQERRAAREQAKLKAEEHRRNRESNKREITKYRNERLRYLKRRPTVGTAVFVLRAYLKGKLFCSRGEQMAEIVDDRGADVTFPYTVRWYDDGLTKSTLPEEALMKAPRQKDARKQLRLEKKAFMQQRHQRGDLVEVVAPALKRMGPAFVSQEGKTAVVTLDLGPGYAFPYKVEWETDGLASPSHVWLSAPELLPLPPPALKLVDNGGPAPPAQWYFQEAGASSNSWAKFEEKEAAQLENARKSLRSFKSLPFVKTRMVRRDQKKLALQNTR